MMPWWLCRTESFWLWRTNGGEMMLVVNSPLKFPRVLLSNFVPCSWTLWSHQDLELTIDNLRYPNYTEGQWTQCTKKCKENKITIYFQFLTLSSPMCSSLAYSFLPGLWNKSFNESPSDTDRTIPPKSCKSPWPEKVLEELRPYKVKQNCKKCFILS